MTRVTGCVTALLMLVAAVAPAQADVYRWVDEKGNVHFGDQPTEDTAPEEVKVPKYTPDAHTLERMENQKRYMDARETDREKAAEQKKKDEARAKEYADACEKSRQRLSVLESGTRLYIEKDGERHYLTDEERVAETKETEAKVKEYCAGPPKN